MRIAALYDIHGNLPALEAVLDDVQQAAVDQIVVGGDVIPGPMPRETLDCLRDLDIPARFIKGNGEREVLALRPSAAATAGNHGRKAVALSDEGGLVVRAGVAYHSRHIARAMRRARARWPEDTRW